MSRLDPDRTHIDRYRLTGPLGQGGMGAVYLAHDEELDRPVAIKVLFDLNEEENLVRFEREARALARLTHSNVVQVYDRGEVDGYPYFAMELVDGGSLAAELEQRGALVPDEAIAYAVQAARGLAAAAEAGLIHRDVKPHNLLLTTGGTLKLVDFGLARLGAGPSTYTTRSAAMGTPYYMAPEQARGDELDWRADQYALGATLYHLLAGRPPFEASSDVALLLKHQQEPPPPLPDIAPLVPQELWRVVARMLAKERSDRFTSYDDLVEALYDAAEPEARSRRAWPVLAAMLLAGAIGGGVLFWNQTRVAESPEVGPTVPDPANQPDPSVPDNLSMPRDQVSPRQPAPTSLPAPASQQSGDSGSVVAASLMRSAGTATGQDRLELLRRLANIPESSTLSFWQELLRHGGTRERPLAARALGRLGDQRATPALIEALDATEPGIVAASVEALGQLRDLRSLEPLDHLASTHPHPDIRQLARNVRRALFDVSRGN